MNCPTCGAPNPSFHKFCRNCGTSLGGLNAAEAERRMVTVVFADMSGFTAMSGRLDPEEVQELMNNFYQALAACVYRYGGTVLTYTGDGIMAGFGAPRAHEDDAERALASALEMRESAAALNRRFAKRLPQNLGIHIGINSGEVIAGRVGQLSRSDYTVLGDAVNVAARLEDKSEDGQILVSEATYRLTRHAFRFDEPFEIEAKGKGRLRVYELKKHRSRRESRRGDPNIGSRALIGRDEEMERMRQVLERLDTGNGALVLLSGPAGIGKTRLVDAARLATATLPMRWAVASCPSLGLGGSLAVWLALVRVLLGVDDTRRRASSAMPRSIAAHPPRPPHAGETMRVSPLLTGPGTRLISIAEIRDSTQQIVDLLDVLPEGTHTLPADDEQTRNLVLQGIRALVEREALARPLVLVFDDFQWVDTASFQALQRLLPYLMGMPVVVALVFRSDGLPQSADPYDLAKRLPEDAVFEVELPALTAAQGEELATAILGDDIMLSEVRRFLAETSGGNPLFMEELVRSLRDQGALRHESGRWLAGDRQGAVLVPETIQGLLLDRIDRLPEAAKRLAQVAAVFGRTFPAELLAELVAGADAEAQQLLAPLEAAGIVERADGPAGADYRFRQALLQEAAYSSLLHRNRQWYHGRVADLYLRMASEPDPPPELPAILTLHLERAERWAEAARWTLRAAAGYQLALAPRDAEEHYQRALSFAERGDDADARMSALIALGDLAVSEGELELALDQYDNALAAAVHPLDAAAIERRIGRAYDAEGRHSSALAAFDRAVTWLAAQDSSEVTAERARISLARAYALLHRGAPAEAEQAAAAALAAGLASGDRADVVALTGETALAAGNAASAQERFEEALTLAREAGDHPRCAVLLDRLAAAQLAGGREVAARGHLLERLDICRRLGDENGVAGTLIALAALDEKEGALSLVVERLREAAALAMQRERPALAARAQLHLGLVLRDRGEWEAARAAFERAGGDDAEAAGRAALEITILEVAMRRAPVRELLAVIEEASTHGAVELAARARLALATVYRRGGDRAGARVQLRAVLQDGARLDPVVLTESRIVLAELARDEGRPGVAVEACRLAVSAAERTGPAHALWRARRLLGAALWDAGDTAAGEQLLQDVAGLTRTNGARPELARTLADWTARRAAGQHKPDETAALRRELADLAESLSR